MKNKIITILLVLTLLFSFIGCGETSESIVESTSESEGGATVVENEYILRNGATFYEVLYPANATQVEMVAVSEFTTFFKNATGVSMRSVSDDKMKPDGKYISIGYTSLLAQTDLTYSAQEIKVDGFKIKTVGDDILIFGASDYGTLYGVYDALGYLLNFEYFYTNTYRLNKGVTNLNFYNFDIVEIPDIEYRAAGYGMVSANTLDAYRLRMRPYPEFFIPVNGIVFHNSISWVGGNGAWLSNSGKQLCYTAGGDEEQFELMLEASLETLKTHLAQYPDRNVITYTIEDNPDFCSCDACKEVLAEYNGVNSSVVILYLNAFNKKVKEWFETEEGKPYKRDLDIVFFAYNATTDAPVEFNEATQKYEGINGLKLDDGVSVMYAPIAADYTTGLTKGDNAQYYKTAKQWHDISKNVYLWIYSTNFSHYLAPYDTFDGIEENYRVAKEINTRWIFDQAQWNEYGFSTGWSTLKSYLNAKLAWDTTLDLGVLIDDFFATYFGPAEAEMREIFNQMRTLTVYNKVHNSYGGIRSIYQNVMYEKFWPKGILKNWIDLLDKALEKIEPLKTANPTAYRDYYKHIVGERISIYYLYIGLYSYNTDENLLNEYKRNVTSDIATVGITLSSESSGDISGLLKGWG